MDFALHVEEQFAWLLHMARIRGAREHARLRCQELEALDPMYAGMEERVRQAMQSESSSPSEPAEGRTEATVTGAQRGSSAKRSA